LTQGSGELSYNRARELQDFLTAVVRKRGHPLHLANLWNALYFAYDLPYGGFHADQINPERIPIRTAAKRNWSLPIGGFVRVHTETDSGDLVAEVVYKEGAHHSLEDDGWVSGALSGAPASESDEFAGETVRIVRERFALDLEAFGPEGNKLKPKQFDRLCRKAHWLDEHGHLLIEAVYTPEEAELEDIDYYVDYLLREHRDGLLAYCFDVELSDEELREVLLRSFEAVRALALEGPELECWRGKYFFCRDDLWERIRDHDCVLGKNDLDSIYRSLSRLPAREKCAYSLIGPRIVELLERGGLDPGEEALLRGCNYATMVCFVNYYVSDELSRDQAKGVLPSGIHLRLDDDWQQGGIWRAELVSDPLTYSLKAISHDVPLGLGYAESVGAGGLADEFAIEAQPLAASQTHFRFALTLRDRELERLRLTREAESMLAPGEIEVHLRCGDLREHYAARLEEGKLYGIRYPFDLHPGIVLDCKVEKDGSIVRVYTTLASGLVALDGTESEWETDISVYEREMRLTPLEQKDRGEAPTLRELVNRAFRTCGRKRDDGSRALSFSDLAQVIFGLAWTLEQARPLAVVLETMGLERDGAEYIWHPRVTRHTRSSDRSLLEAYGESMPTGRIRHSVRRHMVRMHLRANDELYYRTSREKRRDYAEARRQYGVHSILPEELPEGCTWVKPHTRGGGHSEAEDARLFDEHEISTTPTDEG